MCVRNFGNKDLKQHAWEGLVDGQSLLLRYNYFLKGVEERKQIGPKPKEMTNK